MSRVIQSLSPRLVSHPATCFVHLQPCLQKVTVTADASPLSNHCLLPLLRQSPEKSCFFSQRQPPEFLYFSHWQAGWLPDYLISLLASAGERLGLIFEFLSKAVKLSPLVNALGPPVPATQMYPTLSCLADRLSHFFVVTLNKTLSLFSKFHHAMFKKGGLSVLSSLANDL